ncbi:MAG: WD40 repeat domain-containing protein, partial [Planctomycetota bacterium]
MLRDGRAGYWVSGENQFFLKKPFEDIVSASFIPHKNEIFTLSKSGVMELWDAGTGEHMHEFQGKENKTRQYAFSADGARLAVASNEGFIRFWSLGIPPVLMLDFSLSTPVDFISFVQQGECLAIADGKGRVKIWPLNLLNEAKERFPRSFTYAERKRYNIVRSDGNSAGSNADTLPLIDPSRSIPSSLSQKRPTTEPVPIKDNSFDDLIFDPYELNEQSWGLVTTPAQDLSTYQRGLSLAETACQFEPQNKAFRITKGVALYRVGRIQDSLDLLCEDEIRLGTDTEGGRLSSLFFAILSLAKLDRQAEAQALYAELRPLLNDPWESRFPLYRFLLEELMDSEEIQDRPPEGPAEAESGKVEPFYCVARKASPDRKSTR